MPPITENIKTDSTTPVPKPSSATSIVVFGASGDLAKKKTYPALFSLYKNGYLPKTVQIIGYARTQLDAKSFHGRITEKLPAKTDADKKIIQEFIGFCSYVSGGYDERKGFEELKAHIAKFEKASTAADGYQRVFYLALPPDVFEPVCKEIKEVIHDSRIVHRVIVEKPFGHDLDSSNELSAKLSALLKEEELYRIDHYLGKEMVKNLLVMKFANVFFSGIWNRNFINNIQITFKEDFGTEGRGGYFDQYGIIRDVIQNHLLQVLSLVAMECPVDLSAESVRDEKVKVLKCIKPVPMDKIILGQYAKSADGSKPGYLDDKTVPAGSNCPTFAAMILHVNNERWSGVPFILKAGKALDEKKVEIRIQFEDHPGTIFPDSVRNELVIRLQPDEAVYLKMMVKKPGLGMETTISELDLSYKSRYNDAKIPDAYEALILDVLNGDRSNFVRSDELEAAWKIFTPALHHIEREKVKPIPYLYGSRYPAGTAEFIRQHGYVRSDREYIWSPSAQKL